jgi:hypothetical protein
MIAPPSQIAIPNAAKASHACCDELHQSFVSIQAAQADVRKERL